MSYALILNIAIIGAVITGMVVLHNPLALFGLLLIKEMPYGLMIDESQDEDEESGTKIGFVREE